ncbi:hypothetical protein M501DRAFT_1017296 [Patellaria atrata CBS 101060]|uniref:Uncharacterized protein n=1 Tax=Patellaria atrata CBS 101060 TaxID=1346257 RepID=A0A9P4VQF9_9PEZI|nr:hypothetical protein M501DRAFT_1017296 [Patellaria atrata CBS 101060]
MPHRDLCGQAGYDAQWRWWVRNGKTFDIMRLPSEIRELLYFHTLGFSITPVSKSIPPFPKARPKWHAKLGQRQCAFALLPRGSPEQPVSPLHKMTTDRPNLEILRLNKQIGEEALYMAWTRTPKYFSMPWHAYGFFRALDTVPYTALRVLHLDFEMKDWFIFFGVSLPGIMNTFRSEFGCGKKLKEITQIQMLTMEFPSTKYGALYDPWAYIDGLLSRGGATYPQTSCQKVLVDWILSFGFEYIKHIPRIELKGCVKDSTRRKWESIFDERREGKFPAIDASEIGRERGQEYPPKCSCTKSCQFDTYHEVMRQSRMLYPAEPSQADTERWKEMMDKYEFNFDD